jgi:hypothetical protein
MAFASPEPIILSQSQSMGARRLPSPAAEDRACPPPVGEVQEGRSQTCPYKVGVGHKWRRFGYSRFFSWISWWILFPRCGDCHAAGDGGSQRLLGK